MPGQPTADRRRASLSLNLTVVGGSISGVATAYSLQKAGHQVTIVEKSDGKTWSQCGIRSPPNMTRLLNQWGLEPAMKQFGNRCTQFVFRNGENGETIGVAKLHEEFLKDLLADFVFIQHGDLHQLLCKQALAEGVKFQYNATVTHVDPENVSVTLANGDHLASDVIIGADGYTSIVRPSVVGKPVPEQKERDLSLSFTLPTDSMREGEGLRWWAETDWNIWLCDGCLVHGSVINSGQDFNMVIIYRLSREGPEFNEEWTDTYPLEYFLEQYDLKLEKFEPRVRKLVEMAKDIRPHIYVSRPDPEHLVSEKGRLVLVGEAAHPQIPCGQQNAGLGLEDAQILGSLFSGIHRRSQVPQLLAAYEELRLARCIATHGWEKRKRAMLTLPLGEKQEERDQMMGVAMADKEWESIDEKVFRAIWGGELELYAYDAFEKAEDWWTKWGPILARESADRRSFAPIVQVSISKEDG